MPTHPRDLNQPQRETFADYLEHLGQRTRENAFALHEEGMTSSARLLLASAARREDQAARVRKGEAP